MDYIQSIFRAYKGYLRANGVRPPHRHYIGVVIYELKELGAIRFDHAEVAQGWRGMEAEAPPRGYRPACGSPAPRHFYRLVNPQHPGFSRPDAEFRRSRGLEVPEALPRVRVPKAPPAPAAPRVRRPRRARAIPPPSALETRVAAVISTLPQIQAARTPEAVASLEKGLLDLAEEAQRVAQTLKGADRERIGALASRLIQAAQYAGLARSSLETLARETLPLRQQAAQRSFSSAWGLMGQALAPTPPP